MSKPVEVLKVMLDDQIASYEARKATISQSDAVVHWIASEESRTAVAGLLQATRQIVALKEANGMLISFAHFADLGIALARFGDEA